MTSEFSSKEPSKETKNGKMKKIGHKLITVESE